LPPPKVLTPELQIKPADLLAQRFVIRMLRELRSGRHEFRPFERQRDRAPRKVGQQQRADNRREDAGDHRGQ